MFVVDQIDLETGRFDEHKAIIGVGSQAEAEALYDVHFSDGSGPSRRAAVTSLSIDEFKTWLRDGDTTKPIAPADLSAASAVAGARPPETDIAPPPGADPSDDPLDAAWEFVRDRTGKAITVRMIMRRLQVPVETARAIHQRLIEDGDLTSDGVAVPSTERILGAQEGGDRLAGSRAAGNRQAEPGVNYTGFVQDRVEGETPEEPIRREDILRPLLKALDLPLYQGRMKGRKILGFFRPRVEETRIKRMGDIETAAHEIAHALDHRFPEIRKQWLPARKLNAEFRKELRGVSYDRNKVFEGFAEFVRLWMTQAGEARARAPKFHGWWEDFVARSDNGPALRKAQEDMHAWFAQESVSRARSKIGKVEEINAGLTSVFDRFRQSVADDLHGIQQMEKDLTGGISPVGAYETARLTRAKHSIIEGSLLYGAPVVEPDGSHKFVGKGLDQILDPVSDRLDDFLMYAVGRSAGELSQQGRENLFTQAEIDGMLGLKRPEFVKAFREYQHWNRRILDFAEAKGIINPNLRATWKRAQYLPFHRVGQPGAFSAVPGDWKGIKALTGGTDNLRDVLENVIGNAGMLIDAALVNEARIKVAKLSQLRRGAKFMAKIPTDERVVQVHRAEVERAILEALGVKKRNQLPPDVQVMVDQIVLNMEVMVPLAMRGQTPLGGNVVAVLRNGKPEYYEVADPLLYRSLTHLNRPTKNWLVKILSLPKRIGQSSITLAADFMAANLARDTLMGAVMSRHGFRLLIDSAKGMTSRIKADENYREYIANGGGFASYLVDEDAFRTHLERFYTRKGINPQTVLDTPKKLLLGVERIAEAVEMATRLGEFQRARKKGEHPRHAAYSAREVSTDFAMRGDSAALGFMFDTVMFLKAGVNGIDRYYRGIVHDPNKAAIAGKTALLAAASAALYAFNRDNPLYDDLEDWDKDTSWHFFVPTPEALDAWNQGRDVPIEEAYVHLRYPKIWEIGAIASIAERGLGGFLDEQPAETAKHSLRVFRDVFRFEYLPQGIAPLAEQAMNRIRFLERDIESEAMQSLEPWARTGPHTSRSLKKVGEATRKLPRAFQVSPAKLEALLRGYLNTWAVYGLALADGAMFDDMPDMRLDEYPVLRRFYRQEPARNTRHVKALYEAIRAATEVRRTMRHMDRLHRPELAAELETKTENRQYPQLTKAARQMRAINKELRRVSVAPSLDDVRRARARER